MRKALEEYLVGIPNQDMVSRWLLTAQYHIENGEKDLGVEYLVKLCTETVSNYEEAIGFRELTPVWEKYKHLVAGKVPPSLAFNTVKALPPEKCSMQIGEILASGADLLENLSEHLGELSGGGECLNSLNQWERTAFYVDELCAEVNSGGFGGYLYYHGRHFEKAKQALEILGAGETLALLEQIRGKFPRRKVPKSLDRLQDALDQMEDRGVDFEAEDECYYGSAEKELLQKLREYVTGNGNRFR